MAKPTNDLSDDQLSARGIANGEYEGREALIASEILQRRHERARSVGYRFGRIIAMDGRLAWLTVQLRLRKKTD